ncbi:hypothetical protein CC85DRAFT_268327 [Cutaneotrichosporon oleaginosum]|uniref:GYF domain-containing protein n=1 Tax=Cutaneotrichosporon oleaginosum TaxID=879819 RepID=A0A0J0XXL4_9TREE|nr:uncharacterized protein CC85DRAFT_268327 [Cutaneotrichosporon oleaginosum]KLT45820.1 hypothetical protein CC85DRAFT_268327 [Cutaneotrichosporon oleaginosum]TXT06527.1 hypothetical protein COLE_05858 [Cutaneotrichosporon oleaginosum]
MPVKRTGGDTAAAPKRTRFAEPASAAGPSKRALSPGSASNDGVDDEFLEADITETSRNAKKRERAALRDQDGYGSDSSNDEESVVPSRRPNAKEDDDEDVDMFGDDDADEPKDKGKGKEKKKDFMDLGDVEGQEDLDQGEAKRFARADAEDSDSEVEEQGTGLDGPMGVEITPFNMKKEFEEGRFTEGGETYVENEKDPHEQHDHWLDGADKDAIKKARRAHRERERIEREREAREAELASGEGSEEREHRLMRDAVELMERGETVLEALQRLGAEAEARRRKEEGGQKKKSWAERQRERKASMAIDTSRDPEHGSPFGRLTAIVSGLQAIGQLDVYSLSREAIQRMLPRDETAPAAPARPPPDNRAFQYRFSLAYLRTLPEEQRPVEREVFGPFSQLQLRGWKATGFFGPNCENIEVRVVNPSEEQPWGTWDAVVEKK